MQYHALALAVNAGDVDLVGLEGAPLHAALTSEPRLRSHRLSDGAFRSRASGGRRRFVLMSAARAGLQATALLRALLRLPKPDVILVTGDHSTPSLMKSHSWHPVPLLMRGGTTYVDDTRAFGETECRRGALGRFPSVSLLPQALAAAGRLDKFGA